jgi:mono/diheme cytochrome c family protein
MSASKTLHCCVEPKEVFIKMRNALLLLLAVFLVANIGSILPSTAKKNVQCKVDGEQIFKQHCASCHAGGGNSVKPKHPVSGSKELATLATFKAYLSAPPGHMPYYQDVVGNRRILEALYNYCKNLPKQPIKQVLNPEKRETACVEERN